MRFLHKKNSRKPAVIIVALIDVLLVVLIFLMVTTTAKKLEPAFKLNLPNSKESKTGASDEKPFVVQVATNFPYFFIGERATTLGLLIAIPALISWSYYTRKVETFTVQMESLCDEFLRKHYRGDTSVAPAPATALSPSARLH